MTIPIIIITNNAYSYLWPIINDLTLNLKQVFICGNDFEEFQFNKNITKIIYNQKDSYTKRVCSVIEKINCKHLLLLHDIDLIINLDQDVLKNYLELIIKNNVDRLSLGVFNTNDSVISTKNITITKLSKKGISKNFFTPFDYAPSIYKKDKLLELYSTFDESYQNFELRDDVQNFTLNNLNCYGIKKINDNNVLYHRGFAFTKELNFLHLTIKGKLLPFYLYYDLESIVKNIVNKYSLLNTCNFHPQNFFIHKNEII